MMEFTPNYCGKRGNIYIIKLLNKRASDHIHEIIPTTYQKYPSNTILNMQMF